MSGKPEDAPESTKRRVERHSPKRLLRRPVELPCGLVIAAERHKGRIVVRLELPRPEN
jgi:hypothetical protein